MHRTHNMLLRIREYRTGFFMSLFLMPPAKTAVRLLEGLPVFQLQLPFPGGAHHFINIIADGPAQFFPGYSIVGIDRDHVARAPRSQLVIQLYTAYFFKGVYRFQDSHAVACTEVEDFE